MLPEYDVPIYTPPYISLTLYATVIPAVCSPLISAELEDAANPGTLPTGFTVNPTFGYDFYSDDLNRVGEVISLQYNAVDVTGTVWDTAPFLVNLTPAIASVTIDSDFDINYDISTGGIVSTDIWTSVIPVECSPHFDYAWSFTTGHPFASLNLGTAPHTVDVTTTDLSLLAASPYTDSINLGVTANSGKCVLDPVTSVVTKPVTYTFTCPITSVSLVPPPVDLTYTVLDAAISFVAPVATVVPAICGSITEVGLEESTNLYPSLPAGFTGDATAGYGFYSSDPAQVGIFSLKWIVIDDYQGIIKSTAAYSLTI